MRLRARLQGLGQAFQPGVVGRQAEAQEIAGPVETAAPDVIAGKNRMERSCFGMARQPEQSDATGNRPAGFGKNSVELVRLTLQRIARAGCPWSIQQRGVADGERRSGAGPWTKRGRDGFSDLWGRDCESETKACQAKEFAERSKNDHRKIAAQSSGADCRIEIDKGFIDHQPAAALANLACDPKQRGVIDDAAVRIVGIYDDGMVRGIGQNFRWLEGDDTVAGLPPGGRVLAVGRTRDSHDAMRRESWQPLDECLRARRDGDGNIVGNAIGVTRRFDQRGFIGARWQPGPDVVRQLRNRPRPGIDPGRKIEPCFRCAAVLRDCFGQVAAMLHERFMPLSSVKGERIRWDFAVVVLALIVGIARPACAADLPRVASINLCTDQLLMSLADPDQILGLSPYAQNGALSWAAADAKRYRRLSGEAEDVLMLKPDVVVAGRYTKRATRELLKQQGLRVAEFDIAKSIDDVKSQIRRMGDLVKHPDRAAALIARLDAAITRAKQAVARKPYRVLALSRRGWVSGDDSVTNALLSIIGLSNAASSLGVRHGGFAKLETIIALKPDFILVSSSSNVAEDEGRALLLHPALEKLYPPSRRIVIPEDLTVCGGPMLPDALDRLVAELKRVGG